MAFIAAGSVMAQDAPKKKGGFWNKVKKGVESATGIDVSRETLFVNPKPDKWKLDFKSAIGDPTTGNVAVVIKVKPLNGQSSLTTDMLDVIDGDGNTLVRREQWDDGLKSYHLSPGVYTDCPFRRITVRPGMKSLKMIHFTLSSEDGFEARDIPITWEETD